MVAATVDGNSWTHNIAITQRTIFSGKSLIEEQHVIRQTLLACKGESQFVITIAKSDWSITSDTDNELVDRHSNSEAQHASTVGLTSLDPGADAERIYSTATIEHFKSS